MKKEKILKIVEFPLKKDGSIDWKRKKETHRHKFKPIRGTNYYIKRCEICGEIYAKEKNGKTTIKKPSR
jgi:hypothetical protein